MELPKRKPARLKDYDYGAPGMYFVTICTKDRRRLLSEINFNDAVGTDNIRPKLTQYGNVVDKAIDAIPSYYYEIKIDKYVIMPNHIHMIMIICNDNVNGWQVAAPTIMRVVGQMKRKVSKEIGFPIWQKSFYDHIIRDEEDYRKIWEYIDINPLKWKMDYLYCDN